MDLPITAHKQTLTDAIRNHSVVILVAETGSGKTTQLPQFLHPEFTKHKTVACTQPRRVACTSVANRVAQEMNTECGQLVGYKIRFVDKTSRATKLLYLTDGMAVREASSVANFDHYSVLLIDEAHERSIHTDLMLGLSLQAINARRDLKVVVMSATLDWKPLVEFYGKDRCKVIEIPGRSHPVKMWYTPTVEEDWLEAALLTVIQVHLEQAVGDILVFLPGQDSIEQLAQLLGDKRKLLPTSAMDISVCPLYAALPFEQQVSVFDPPPANTRKVVLATNIAETSITIPGIKYVVDSGFVKLKVAHHATGMQSLKSTEISKAMAKQRAGRAGREGPGECFRLFPAEEFEKFQAQTPPEILRSEMSQVFLTLKDLNISMDEFPFLDRPFSQSITKACTYLCRIGALTPQKQLTEVGKKLARLPLHPQFGILLLTSVEFECIAEILTLTAMLSVDAVFIKTDGPATFTHPSGDHLTLISLYRAWKKSPSLPGVNTYALKRAKHIRDQLKTLLQHIDIHRITSCGEELDKVRRCLAKACFTHTARFETVGYVTVLNRDIAKIHPQSQLFGRKPPPAMIVYNDLVTTSKNYLRICTAIEAQWLMELRPKYFGGTCDSSARNDACPSI